MKLIMKNWKRYLSESDSLTQDYGLDGSSAALRVLGFVDAGLQSGKQRTQAGDLTKPSGRDAIMLDDKLTAAHNMRPGTFTTYHDAETHARAARPQTIVLVMSVGRSKDLPRLMLVAIPDNIDVRALTEELSAMGLQEVESRAWFPIEHVRTSPGLELYRTKRPTLSAVEFAKSRGIEFK